MTTSTKSENENLNRVSEPLSEAYLLAAAKGDQSYRPTPANVAFCGLPAALSVTDKAALREPVALGLNLTLIVQLAPAVNELPQV